MAVLYTLALITGTHLPDEHPAVTNAIKLAGNDRLAHFFGYLGLSFLLFGFCGLVKLRRAAGVGLLFGLALFGACDELTQPWFARSAEWLDWMADLFGIGVGFGIAWVAARWGLPFLPGSRGVNHEARAPDQPNLEQTLRAAAPVLIGLCFALWGLREVEAGTTVHSDASRHAMNGALIHDYLDSGGLCHPIRYVQDYYSRLPALSLPYHPPLFPAVEALFYAVFGVNLLAARLAVALSVLVCAILLYRLVERASGSVVLAGLVTVCFFALPSSGFLASDVMLEMPALVFTLAALSCLRDLPDRFSLGQGIAFGVLAGAAVWTKQQTVFLGLVPFFVVGLTRRWRLLVSPALWVAGLLLGLLVLLFLALPQPATFQGFSNELPARAFFKTVAHHVPYYVQGIEWEFGLVGTLIIGLSIGWLLAGCWRQDANASCVLPLAWILGQISFLLVIGKYDHRYFFLAYPALVWAALVGLRRIGQLTWKRTEWVLPALAVLLVLIGQVRTPPSSISGPFEAARHVVAQKATRVLYCGQTDGAFIFAIRALAPPGFVVIRGDKTPHKAFTLTGLEDFVQRHGIDFVILEQTRFQERWAHLYTAPPPGLACETEISLRLYPYRSVNGTLRVFRVKASSPQPPLPFGQLPLAGIQEEVTASERNDHHNAPTLPLPGEVGGKAARRSRGPNAAD